MATIHTTETAEIHYLGKTIPDAIRSMAELGYRPGYRIETRTTAFTRAGWPTEGVKPPKLRKGETCERRDWFDGRQMMIGWVVWESVSDVRTFVEVGSDKFGPKTIRVSEREETEGEFYVSFSL